SMEAPNAPLEPTLLRCRNTTMPPQPNKKLIHNFNKRQKPKTLLNNQGNTRKSSNKACSWTSTMQQPDRPAISPKRQPPIKPRGQPPIKPRAKGMTSAVMSAR
ncbi:hypothetical protein, partial [Oryzicola mucosus]|uniref:hypothetical protein n=1 Tax=Oryzicola mucosus TaxID=2767425 RepID=UPI001AEDBC9C